MFKKILTAALAAGALALNAPVALADDPAVECGFDSVQQETTTGQNYEGAAWCTIGHAEGGAVSIRGYITVNGSEAATTPTGTGTGAAATAGRVQFSAGATDTVKLCYAGSTPHGPVSGCFESTNTQIPPEAVWDLLIAIAEEIDATLLPVFEAITGLEKDVIDPKLCPVLASLAGTYGPITINAQGDVFVDGEPFWDCPPYDLFP